LVDHAGCGGVGCVVLSVWAGTDPRYLLDQVAKGREGYYVDAVVAGEPPGHWFGAGAQTLGLRGEVSADLMEAIYTHGLDPRDPLSRSRDTWRHARRLGAAPKRYRKPEAIYRDLLAQHPGAGPELRAQLRLEAERLAKHPVVFEDVTFSAPKSVSVVWAACERRANQARAAGRVDDADAWATRARVIEQAVEAGAQAAITYLQEHAGYGRVGHHGGGDGRWIDAHQWVVGMFLQHDSRDGDPQLHVHSAVLNRQLCADGRWRALDTAAIRLHMPAAAAVASRTMETMITGELGLGWVRREDGTARELVGVPVGVCAAFSSRRKAVTRAAQAAITEYEARTGRVAGLWVRHRLTQMACLRTRQPKSHEGIDAEQRSEDWDTRLRRELDTTLSGVADTVFGAPQQATPAVWELGGLTRRVFERLARHRGGRWSRADVILAVSDELPAQLGGPTQDLPNLLERVTDEVLRSAVRLTPEEPTVGLPAVLRLANGSSSYQRPGVGWWADPATLDAERALREAAITRGAVRVGAHHVQTVIREYARVGIALGADQRAALARIAGSGAWVEVVTAPAGAGKSTLVGALARVWATQNQRVVGLATSEAAAQVLAGEGVTAANITRWLTHNHPLAVGDLVVVDEASMTPTMDLLAVQQRCREAGAKLVLVGDPAQLRAVGAGGMLADLTTRAPTHELCEVRRFRETWEGAASLRLRDGDPGAVLDYGARGRLVDGGTQDDTEAAAMRAWLVDILTGHDSLIIVATNEEAARVSALARAELVRLGRVSEHGVWLGRSGAIAGVGDIIACRRNAWELHDRVGSLPLNRARYRVVNIRDDGGLVVRPLTGGAPLTLSPDYVAADVELGYAVTAHCAQGRTVDTAHAILRPGMSREAAYVALTRGRVSNMAYCVTHPTPPEPALARKASRRTARGVLAEILTQEDTDRTPYGSVLAAHKREVDAARSVLRSVDRLAAELEPVVSAWVGQLLDELTTTGMISIGQRWELAADPKETRELGRLLCAADRAGLDPHRVLRDAVTEREWVGVRQVGPVLRGRVRPHTANTPPHLRSVLDLIPRALRGDTRLTTLAETADTRRHELGERAYQSRPLWALKHLGWPPTEPEQQREWVRRASWVATYRELTGWDDPVTALGPPPPLVRGHHHLVWATARHALGDPADTPPNKDTPTAQTRTTCGVEPPHVANQLETAHTARTHARQLAVSAMITATSGNPHARAHLIRVTTTAHTWQAAAATVIPDLEQAQHARDEWLRHTHPTPHPTRPVDTHHDTSGTAVIPPPRHTQQWHHHTTTTVDDTYAARL
jgi:conjugative relaxase-like TrwC/TraI family protein